MRRWMSHHYSYRPTPSSRRRAAAGSVRDATPAGRCEVKSNFGRPAWRCTKVSPVDVHTGRARRPSRARKQRRPRSRSASSLEVERVVTLFGVAPVVVLVDGQSASASEIVAGAYRTTMPVLWSARGPSARVSFRTSLHYHLTARPEGHSWSILYAVREVVSKSSTTRRNEHYPPKKKSPPSPSTP